MADMFGALLGIHNVSAHARELTARALVLRRAEMHCRKAAAAINRAAVSVFASFLRLREKKTPRLTPISAFSSGRGMSFFRQLYQGTFIFTACQNNSQMPRASNWQKAVADVVEFFPSADCNCVLYSVSIACTMVDSYSLIVCCCS